MSNTNFDSIVDEVISRLSTTDDMIVPVEGSGRHIHLSREHVDALFGEGYQLTPAKELSQPGQFACKERVNLIGPKGMLHNVVILGPERDATQVEISLTDGRTLGVNPAIRLSGDIEGAPGIIISNGTKAVSLDQGLIAAKRHIHIKDSYAEQYGLKQNEVVKVKILSNRPLVFDDVVIRISPNFENSMHIDYDEGNACALAKDTKGIIIRQ